MTRGVQHPGAPRSIVGDGEVARRLRELDWSSHPLGPSTRWPRNLRTAITLMLASRHPMLLWWGEEPWSFHNDACIPVLGAEHAEALGRDAREVWGDVWAELAPAIERARGGEATVRVELPVRSRGDGGGRARLAFTCSPIPSDDGGTAGVLCACLEDAQRALAAADGPPERLREVLESMSDTYVAADREWRVTYANGVALRVNGKQRDEVVGRPLWEVFPKARGTAIDTACRRAMDGEETFAELRGPHSGRWFELSIRPTRDGIAIFGRDVTDRREAEAALRRSEARLRLITDALPSLVSYVDLEERYRFNNHAYAVWFGTPAEDLRGRTLREVVGDAAYAKIEGFVRRALAGELVAFETLVPYRSAGLRLVEASYVPDVSETGTVRGFHAFVVDVSERRRSEEALRASEERYRTLFDSMDEGFCSLELQFDESARPVDYRFLDLNAAFERLTGLRGARGKRMRELAPDREPSLLDVYGEIARTGTRARFEHRSEALDRWYEVHAFRIGPAEARQVAVLFNDLSERKLAQMSAELLVGIDDAMRSLVEPGEIVATATRLLAEHLHVARCAYVEVGADQDGVELVGQYDRDVPVPACGARLSEFGTRCLELVRTGESYVVHDAELDERAADAREVHAGTRGRALVWAPIRESGRLVAALTVQHPTPRRWLAHEVALIRQVAARCWESLERARAMRKLRDLVARLEQREHERGELLERERAARREAEHATRQKDDFVSTLSHELRTPINAVLGWAHLGCLGALKSEREAEKAFEVIERNARMQSQLISDLLDVTRIAAGKLRLDKRPVDAREAVEDALLGVEQAAKDRGVVLERDLGRQVATVIGDPGRLQQIVSNLLTNAIKFTPPGGRVAVRLEADARDVRIVVEDTGRGIDPDFLPHLFERFRQADASTTRRAGGLGLGLAISKQLVELHDGTIHAASEGSGRGATFVVTLPVASGEPEGARPRVAPDPDEIALVSLDGVRVLVVDDERDARELVERVLVERGAAVDTVASAHEALEALARARPAVVVSDIGMPDEDGYALVHRIRALSPDEGGTTPAVALTAFARAEDRTRALVAGFQAHVTKPVEPDELCATIASLLGRTGRSPAAAR